MTRSVCDACTAKWRALNPCESFRAGFAPSLIRRCTAANLPFLESKRLELHCLHEFDVFLTPCSPMKWRRLQITSWLIDNCSSINEIFCTDVCGCEHCIVKWRDTLSVHIVWCCFFAVEQVSYSMEVPSLCSLEDVELWYGRQSFNRESSLRLSLSFANCYLEYSRSPFLPKLDSRTPPRSFLQQWSHAP